MRNNYYVQIIIVNYANTAATLPSIAWNMQHLTPFREGIPDNMISQNFFTRKPCLSNYGWVS